MGAPTKKSSEVESMAAETFFAQKMARLCQQRLDISLRDDCPGGRQKAKTKYKPRHKRNAARKAPR